jgi:hypothetical protein
VHRLLQDFPSVQAKVQSPSRIPVECAQAQHETLLVELRKRPGLESGPKLADPDMIGAEWLTRDGYAVSCVVAVSSVAIRSRLDLGLYRHGWLEGPWEYARSARS